jgi:voltage-gated sodium channel
MNEIASYHNHDWTWRSLSAAVKRHDTNPIDTFMIGVIVLAGITVGLETSRAIVNSYGALLHIVDVIIVGLFALEAVIKISMHWPHPWRYFKSGWNVFDFAILLLTALPFLLSMTYEVVETVIAIRTLSMIRSLRALRFLRLTSEFRGIRIVVETLVRSLPQLGIVALLLFSLLYTYAVIGFNVFHLNDPKHFGSLPQSLLTMFQCALGDFSDIMHIQIDGSQFDSGYYGSLVQHYGSVRSEQFPIIAPLFFLSFVFIAGLTILNFFVGTIISELDSVRSEEHQQTSSLSLLANRLDTIENLLLELRNRH